MNSRRMFLKQVGALSTGWVGVSRVPLAEAAEDGFADGPIVHRAFPLNREPRPARLTRGYITPQSDFYVRNHGTVPRLVEEGYTVRVELPGATPVDMSLTDLRSLPTRRVTAVMQCAGNRRADMGRYKSVSGDAWHAGAIGNAVWEGVGLDAVLQRAGLQSSQPLHVAFGAHDDIEEEGERFKFGVSIPLAKAMAPESLIAFRMNGEPLTAEHGFPLRVVIPGYAGVRSPKWLASIRVQDRPSDNHIQQKEYKLFPPDVTSQTVDLSKGPFIDEMPLNSAILLPAEGTVVPAGTLPVRGWAISTTSPIARVEISADGGRTWKRAVLDSHPDAPWSWTPWTAGVELAKGTHVVTVRAFDQAGDEQPPSAAPIYNYPGYLSRAWHQVKVHAV